MNVPDARAQAGKRPGTCVSPFQVRGSPVGTSGDWPPKHPAPATLANKKRANKARASMRGEPDARIRGFAPTSSGIRQDYLVPVSVLGMHDPAWPDKAMFAAYLLILGGALGLAVEGLRFVGTVQDNLPSGLLENYPHWLSTVLAGVTLIFGIVCLRTQAAVFGYTGAVAGLFSLAYSGLVPFLSFLAIIMLVRSWREGEETRNDGIKLHASSWPDKAMAASLFMVVAAGTTAVQAFAIARGDSEPLWLAVAAGLVLDTAITIFLLIAARRVYHLRNPWLGEVAAVAAALSMSLVVLGPVLGVAILVFMLLARREDEFRKHATGIDAKPAPKPKAKRAGKGA